MQNASGILLHITSLPGPYGIGDLGREARRFIDFLVAAGQHVWQILPTGPTGFGDSPYNALSAFAGNPLLIDLQDLVACGELDQADLSPLATAAGPVDFEKIRPGHQALLAKAGEQFLAHGAPARQQAFADFCAANTDWLDDFALFMALRGEFDGSSWSTWPEELRRREAAALRHWQERLAPACQLHRYQQFVFFTQWHALKAYANQRGVRLFGDIPIFVAYDSADVWANQGFFQLDDQGRPTAVAGVPPDYFSATGQRWGNPLYRWDQLRADDFAWWLRRFRWNLGCADLVRIDHFRGFAASWSIPAEEPTAINGHWEPVPGRELFNRLRRELADPPIIAEDLGIITPDVVELRREFGFPGMKILQFAFDSGPDNPYLPHNYASDCVVYTGTHDNDTTRGWWRAIDPGLRQAVRDYLGTPRPKIPWALIRLAAESTAQLCIFPAQDLLELGPAARLNRPGHATGNWRWRLHPDQLTPALAERLADLMRATGRDHQQPAS